jgi:flagellar basal-body rod protein FlgB
MESLFGKTFKLLSTMLDFRTERSKLINSNIANLDSADYQPSDYVFKEDLRQAMDAKVKLSATNVKHFPNARDEITRDKFQLVKSGERANLDQEMTKLAENQLLYNFGVELLARKFRSINNVLRDAK